MKKYQCFTLADTVCIWNNKKDAVQAMLDYDYICGKQTPSLLFIVDPQLESAGSDIYFWGNSEYKIPCFSNLTDGCKVYKPTVMVNFASERSVYLSTLEALATDSIQKIIAIAEGVPERESRLLKVEAEKKGKIIIGPATVGLVAGGVLKAGNAGGTIENVTTYELYKRGSVGIASKSGGMLNELMTIVSRSGDGVCEAVAVGGDKYPCTTLSEEVLRLEENPDVKYILLLGEIGGMQEYDVAELIASKKVIKPVIAWISGFSGLLLGQQVQFGHAGAKADNEAETTAKKRDALLKAGAIMPNSFSLLEEAVASLVKKLGIQKKENTEKPVLFHDFDILRRRGQMRYKKNIVSSIASPIPGSEASYAGHDIAEVSKEQNIGYILGLLWFKQEFPLPITDYFELILKLCADHGPSPSGAHNTIVAARAGKDLVSSLASGLLTIGPRFGGAVNDAAFYFKRGADTALAPYDFVTDMKAAKTPIPGIGHRIKSKTNPDARVALLLESAMRLETKHTYITYALEVEKITTRKKDSLILNVDGAIAATLLDILSVYMSAESIDALLKMEAFNGFFVLARTIGLIGHFIDQKRLQQPLYRHPTWDIRNEV